MSIRPILIHPDPRLKKLCAPIATVDAEVRKLADDMLATMYDAPGVGLAGPQVGVLSRIFVMDCVKDHDAAADPMVMLNPEITWTSEETNVYEEGCLSIPEQYAEVTRLRSADALAGLDGAKAMKSNSTGSGRPALSMSWITSTASCSSIISAR